MEDSQQGTLANQPTTMVYNEPTEILEETVDTIEHGEIIGNCKWFNKKLGYGFITVYQGEKKGCNIFVHHSGIRPLNSNFKTLRKGEYVHFNIIDGVNGPQATHVTGVCGGPLMCDNVEIRRGAPLGGPPPPYPSSMGGYVGGSGHVHGHGNDQGAGGMVVPPTPRAPVE